MNIQRHNTTMPQVTGQEDRIVAQGTVAAMIMAGLGLIKGYREKNGKLIMASLLLIAAILIFLGHFHS